MKPLGLRAERFLEGVQALERLRGEINTLQASIGPIYQEHSDALGFLHPDVLALYGRTGKLAVKTMVAGLYIGPKTLHHQRHLERCLGMPVTPEVAESLIEQQIQ